MLTFAPVTINPGSRKKFTKHSFWWNDFFNTGSCLFVRMKHIIGVELSHRNAPINVREKIALKKEAVFSALQDLKQKTGEAFILSTCNRLAVYTYDTNSRHLRNFFSRFGDLNLYLDVFDYDEAAIEHLFATAAGLRSQVVGEHQILGQIRHAYEMAKEANSLGPVTHELVKRAIRSGKRVREETCIGQFATSLSSVAFDLAQKRLMEIDHPTILVYGTGEMSNLFLRMVSKIPVKKLYIASRRRQRAEEFAGIYNAKPLTHEEATDVLPAADIVLGATETGSYLLGPHHLNGRADMRPKLLIDLGVPRNFDPGININPKYRVFDLDDIKEITKQGVNERQKEIPKAKQIIEAEADDFVFWLNTKRVHPLITTFYEKLEEAKTRELKWAIPKMGNLDDNQLRTLEKYTNRILGHVYKRPIETLKSYAQEPHHQTNPIDTFKDIFNLKDVHIHIPKRRIIVGSRESKLALSQTNEVIEQLKKLEPDYEFVVRSMKTSGDQGWVNELGAWVKEVENSLLNKEVDLAVHSMKDMPTKLPDGVIIAGVPERADHRDVLISRDNKKLERLPEGANIGTSSMRRAFQVNSMRQGMNIIPIRGNILTRLSKLEGGEYDAIVLAAAGLQRMGILNRVSEIFSVEQMVPAVGQGALAVEIRSGDTELKNLVQQINHRETALAVKAERELLIALGGGCRLPIGGFAQINGNSFTLEGMYATSDGKKINRNIVSGPINQIEALARKLAEELSIFGG